MSDFENEEAKAKEDVAPVVAPEVLAQGGPVPLTQDQENVLWNLQVLDSSDHKLLAQVLRDHPELHEQIIERASADLGNDTVAKALGVLAGVPEPEAPSEKAAEAPAAAAPAEKDASFDYTTSPLALEYDEEAKIKDHADFMRANPAVADQVLAQTAELDINLALAVVENYEPVAETAPAAEAKEETPPAIVEETSRQAQAETQAEPATESAPATSVAEAVEVKAAPEPEKESGWVVRARGFNAEHADEVARFLAATGGACMVDGVLDPNAVAQWQARHGVEVDGRIGEGTVDAAIKSQPQTFDEAAKEAEEEQLPEPDPTDPRFAL